MSFRVGGLASGLDTNTMIEQLLQLERQPITALQFRQKIATTKADAFKDVTSRMTSLRSLAFDLTLDATFQAKKVTSGNAAIVTASAGPTAAAGTYSVNVEQLAKAHMVSSKQFADSTSALGLTGTFQINGKSVTVAAGDSLTAIRNTINGTADIGVTATIVDNTLRIQSKTTGRTQIAFVDDAGTDILTQMEILDATGAIKTTLVNAQDAIVKIDNQTVQRSSNTISDAIAGVTLSLKDDNPVPADAVTLTIATDTDAIVSKIKQFIDQYNSTLDFIRAKATEKRIAKPKTETEKLAGLLSGDVVLSDIQFGLRNDTGSAVVGLPSAMNSLAKIGISAPVATSGFSTDGQTGRLSINETTLRAAIESDIDGVKAVFAKNYGASPFDHDDSGIAVRVLHRADGLIGTGMRLDSMEKSFRSEYDRIQKRIDILDRRVAEKEERLVRQFSRMESIMSSFQTQSNWLSQQIAKLPKMES